MGIVSIGAILWDLFETERHLGGAPLNVAAHARMLGESVALISAVGNDSLGDEAIARCLELGLDTTCIARTAAAPTGTVDVFLNDGQPDFTINRPAAYDYPVLSDDDMALLRALEPAWIYFGTLEQLSRDVRDVVCRVMAAFPQVPRFYDINLRKESYTPELIRELLHDATVLKINDEEIADVLELMGLSATSLCGSAERLAAPFDLECVCITRGAAGCAIWRQGEFIECSGVPIALGDAVGAGDAFSAALGTHAGHGVAERVGIARMPSFRRNRSRNEGIAMRTRLMRHFRAALIMLALTLSNAHTSEFFVSTQGDDAASGQSEEDAFATVTKGLQGLKPGDTLTLLPGEYVGASDVRITGAEGQPLIVRAQKAGTVTLRGDVDVTGFQRVPGMRYTWWTPLESPVEGVAERDTSTMYAFVPSVAEVEDVRRACFHDSAAGRLYVHTSDSASPETHRMVASVTSGFGIIFNIPRGERGPHDIVVEGLAFTGYMSRDAAPRPGSLTRWGLYFVQPERCVVRKCRAYLNGGGIGLVRPNDCLVEDCIAYGNFSTFCASGGNIISWSPAMNTIMRRNIVHTTNANGIRFYGNGTENCALEDNLSYGCKMGGIWIKGGTNATSRMVRNVSLGAIYNSGGVDIANIRNNLCSFGSNIGDDPSNIQLSKLRQFDLAANVADPAHHDYRLQSDSVLRGTGSDGSDPGPFPYRPDVFFVGPGGDDTQAGTSVKEAWRSLGHAAGKVSFGQTLYVLPGLGDSGVARASTMLSGVTVRRRGQPDTSHFACTPAQTKMPLRIEDVRVHSTTATTANIEWWTPAVEATTRLDWGPTPACGNTIAGVYNEGIFHTVSLIGLTPGTRYYFRVSAVSPAWEFHTNADLAELEKEKLRNHGEAAPQSFRTLTQDGPRVTYHVAVGGKDTNSGLSARDAWRTLRHAAATVRAGDTVLIHAGTYMENVPVRVTGDAERPVTFRAAPGEQVWLDGSGQKRNCAFLLAFKHHVHVDGLYFHDFRLGFYHKSGTAGAIHVVRGSANVVRRCFYDGRAQTYMPFFILATDTSAFTLENSVVVQGWNCVSLWRCPDLTVRHCVFYNGLIRNVVLFNDATQPVTFTHNLVCANIPKKYRNALLSVWHLEAYRGDDNCYFSRYSAQERTILNYTRVDGEEAPGDLLLADVQGRTGQDTRTIFANPGIPVVAELPKQYETRADYDRIELHREAGKDQPLDFVHFLADPNGPVGKAADGKPIGLDPAAFTNGRP